jgi:type II secretory pathway component PulF
MVLGLVIGVNVLFVIFLTCLYALVGRRRWRIFLLVEHLATLARQGMPIHSGLRAIGRDLGGYLGSRVIRVADRIEEGRSLGEAFQAAPRSFPPLLRSMLTLGEKSGNLAGFLEEMRRSYRRIAELPYQSVYLFLYPVLLSVIINLSLTGLSAGVYPKFRTLFDQVGVRDGRILVWWPRLMTANEVVLLLCVATVALLMVGGTSIHFGSSLFRVLKGVVDRGVLWMPVIGTMLRDGAVQQFGLCAGLFLRSGATLAEALGAAAEVERNSVLRGRLERIGRGVAEGGRLSSVLKEGGFGGADLYWFVETGEASGLLVDHLLMASAHYETRARLASRVVLRSVVPLFVLLNGAIVAGAYALLFLPITQILRRVTEQAAGW